ncbi:MAG: glycosyltransferase family 2 protein [Lachnospiraceae bacterium]
MSCPRFSFVLPAYKGRYLAESIQSILAQTVTDFELVIVNDCSPDDIASIVAVNSDERIRYYENEQNIGGSDLVAQWNKCLSYARGEYVILATDDDLYEPNFLEAFVPLIEKYPEVGVFRARTVSVYSDGKIISLDKGYREFLRIEEFFYHYLSGIKGGIPQLMFVRSKLIESGGFINFPLAWGSDDATMLKMAFNGIVHSQEFLVKFRWSDINISSDHTARTSLSKLDARLLFCYFVGKIVRKMCFQNTCIGGYLRNQLVDNLKNIQKVIVIKAFRDVPLGGFISAVKMIIRSELFKFRDILSIVYHYI